MTDERITADLADDEVKPCSRMTAEELAAAKARFSARLAASISKNKKPQTAPIYDDIFYDGLAWLDEEG